MILKKLNIIFLLLSYIAIAQIGVGTVNPQPESLLDVYGDDKGLLLPRINISNFDSYTLPSVNHTESLILFNTNTTTGKGFTTWNGTKWEHVNNDIFWSTYGDEGLNASNFIGTSDAHPLIIGTDSTPRLGIQLTRRLENFNLGSISRPAWNILNLGTGFLSLTDNLSLATAGKDFVNVSPSSGVVLNASQNDIALTINGTSTTEKALYLDDDLNSIALLQSDPVKATLHVQNSSSKVRVDGLGVVNANNNGVDKSLLYVDQDGVFTLEATPHVTQLPQFNYESGFLSTTLADSNSTMGANSGVIYSTTQTLHEDALVEIVYQASIELFNSTGGVITDGLPRQYGLRVLVNGRVVGQTSKSFSSAPTTSPTVAGFMYLNGKGYVPLTGTTLGTTHTIQVEAFYDGGGNSTRIRYGGSTNDLLEVIVHY